MEENKLNNVKAWDYLDQALFTSSHVKAKDIKEGSTEWDNVYPTSEEETDRMEELIQQAVDAQDDPAEKEFNDRVRDLRKVVTYSRKRHRTWKWSIIVGSLIGACFMWYSSNQDQESAQNRMKDVKIVELWKAADTTIVYQQKDTITWDYSTSGYDERLSCPTAYKAYYLNDYNNKAESARLQVAKFQHMADTTKSEKLKESYLTEIEKNNDNYEKYRKSFDEMAAKDFKAVQEEALAEANKAVDSEKSSSNTKRGWMIYLIILIPLYIISGYPKGIILSRHRRQASFMRGLQKWGFRIAAFFFGTGLAMTLLPDDIVKYRYSDGRTETRTESNYSNFIVIVIKFGLMIVGICLFCLISIFIMTFETVTGLKRNFNWKKLFSKKSQSTEIG